MLILFHIFVVLITYIMFPKENINVPEAGESLLYGVGYKPLAGGTSYFTTMKIGQGLKGSRNPMYKHGMEGTKIYWAWTSMKQRIYNPNCENYPHYGGRGISLYPEWNDAANFIRWALSHGYKEGLYLDRIDNEKDYSPANCRWVTCKDSNRNKRRSENYGISKKGNSYSVHIRKNGYNYYGGSSVDLRIAIQLRDELILKLERLP